MTIYEFYGILALAIVVMLAIVFLYTRHDLRKSLDNLDTENAEATARYRRSCAKREALAKVLKEHEPSSPILTGGTLKRTSHP